MEFYPFDDLPRENEEPFEGRLTEPNSTLRSPSLPREHGNPSYRLTEPGSTIQSSTPPHEHEDPSYRLAEPDNTLQSSTLPHEHEDPSYRLAEPDYTPQSSTLPHEHEDPSYRLAEPDSTLQSSTFRNEHVDPSSIGRHETSRQQAVSSSADLDDLFGPNAYDPDEYFQNLETYFQNLETHQPFWQEAPTIPVSNEATPVSNSAFPDSNNMNNMEEFHALFNHTGHDQFLGAESDQMPTSSHFPNAGQATYPNAGQATYPNAGQATYPNAGQATYPNFGQATYPNFGQATYPNFGNQMAVNGPDHEGANFAGSSELNEDHEFANVGDQAYMSSQTPLPRVHSQGPFPPVPRELVLRSNHADQERDENPASSFQSIGPTASDATRAPSHQFGMQWPGRELLLSDPEGLLNPQNTNVVPDQAGAFSRDGVVVPEHRQRRQDPGFIEYNSMQNPSYPARRRRHDRLPSSQPPYEYEGVAPFNTNMTYRQNGNSLALDRHTNTMPNPRKRFGRFEEEEGEEDEDAYADSEDEHEQLSGGDLEDGSTQTSDYYSGAQDLPKRRKTTGGYIHHAGTNHSTRHQNPSSRPPGGEPEATHTINNRSGTRHRPETSFGNESKWLSRETPQTGLQVREKETDLWRSAVRHDDIRQYLFRRAGNVKQYTSPRAKGPDPGDETSYLRLQKEWSLENRAGWKKIFGNVLMLYERKDFRAPDEIAKHRGYMMHRDRVVIDRDNRPILDWPMLPATLSTRFEGGYMEAIRRICPDISTRDFWARMPRYAKAPSRSGYDWREAPTISGINMRGLRFRQQNGLIAWTPRSGSDALKEKVRGKMSQADMDNNTTENVYMDD